MFKKNYLKNVFRCAVLVLGSNSIAQAENLPSSSINQSYVDMHAVVPIDFSGSMSDAELRRAMDGLFSYLTSEDSKHDYNNRAVKAVTLVYFLGEHHTEKTYLISSIEDAEKLMASVPTHRKIIKLGTSNSYVQLQHKAILKQGTNVVGALEATRNVYSQDAIRGIRPLRRVVLFIGDYLDRWQTENARMLSDAITNEYGATICPVAVNTAGEKVALYANIETFETSTVKTVDGLYMRPHKCATHHAKTVDAVSLNVSKALGMPRI